MRKFKSILILIVLALSFSGIAQDGIPPKPVPPRLVNDYVGVLTSSEISRLESKLVSYNDSTSTQIVIAIVGDLAGYDPNDFATRLGESWGVGQEGEDNGIVILVKPTGGEGERIAYISTGYGIEPILPDLKVQDIVDYEMIPEFKGGDIYRGLDNATDVIFSILIGEFTIDEYSSGKLRSSVITAGIFLLIFLLIFVGIPARNAYRYSRRNNLAFWAAWSLIASNNRRSNSGGYGHFSGGSGFGGGGFGGFGGGSFGGGGAGGSW